MIGSVAWALSRPVFVKIYCSDLCLSDQNCTPLEIPGIRDGMLPDRIDETRQSGACQLTLVEGRAHLAACKQLAEDVSGEKSYRAGDQGNGEEIFSHVVFEAELLLGVI